jgi:ferrous iron transport protein B
VEHIGYSGPNKEFIEKERRKIPRVLIFGNPNAGKTALFNRLTGMHQKISNFPGVTVERKSGWLRDQRILVEDYPGTYSLQAESPDEKIVSDQVQSWRYEENRPDVLIVVIDSTNLSRNIFLALQLLEYGIPTVLVLNMFDQVRRKKINIDLDRLRRLLGADAVIPASAKYGEGIGELIDTLKGIIGQRKADKLARPFLIKSGDYLLPLQPLVDFLLPLSGNYQILPLPDSLQMVSNDRHLNHLRPFLNEEQVAELQEIIKRVKETYQSRGINYRSLESNIRYAFIDEDLKPAFQTTSITDRTFSERIDQIVTHPVIGSVIFILLLAFIFNAIFSWATYPMEMIESSIEGLARTCGSLLPPSELKNLFIDGVIAGVGNIIVFLPQIILLVFFIGILEDSGYMARMSFMLDGLMGRFGLSGKAVLPMLSGFACAIPAVMAARTVDNKRDRLLIILLIPLMSCSARLPVYTLLISALIPPTLIFGFLNLQGLVLLGVYFLGFITALVIALLVKQLSGKKRTDHYWIELPPYRIPMLRSLGWRVYDAAKKFLINAGSIILAMTMVLWFLASYPKTEKQDTPGARDQVSQSYAGRLGHLLEPCIAPLGFDWKIGVGLISSFAAREVIISTFSTIYNIEAAGNEEPVKLRDALQNDRYPDGRPVFTPLVAMSLLVFFVFAAQCMSTFAIIRRETLSWRWPFLMLIYMNALAYIASLIVFQGGQWLWGS